jgi:hypothetical protein
MTTNKRQISLDNGTTTIPVTDASMSSSREPIIEQSINGKGGEILYGGVYSAVQGSFGGAYRHNKFKSLITNLLSDSPTPYDIIVYDDYGNALESPTSYITSAELTMKVGELCKCTFNFIGQTIDSSNSNSPASCSFSEEIPVFYKSYTSWGDCNAFTIKIERPYTADDYVLSTASDNFYSKSIYQSGETKISGTVTLTQSVDMVNTTSTISTMNIILGYTDSTTKTIAIKNAVLTNIEMGISGRGLINKTKAWACSSSSSDFTYPS